MFYGASKNFLGELGPNLSFILEHLSDDTVAKNCSLQDLRTAMERNNPKVHGMRIWFYAIDHMSAHLFILIEPELINYLNILNYELGLIEINSPIFAEPETTINQKVRFRVTDPFLKAYQTIIAQTLRDSAVNFVRQSREGFGHNGAVHVPEGLL